ncbi:WD40-repeat-containing domain protein [Tribonema minus]|uniref:WD40-repeat-containing domain protein n=1 Tax=Tribonema minus TaxID=303371 RepID=A0A835YR01_9STRA|nr:WD40-repeat-containing domain protein [Tribonema minus]
MAPTTNETPTTPSTSRTAPTSWSVTSSGRRKISKEYTDRLGGAYAAAARTPMSAGPFGSPLAGEVSVGKRIRLDFTDRDDDMDIADGGGTAMHDSPDKVRPAFATPQKPRTPATPQVPFLSPGHTLPGGGGESTERRLGQGIAVYSDRFIPSRSASRLGHFDDDTADENDQPGMPERGFKGDTPSAALPASGLPGDRSAGAAAAAAVATGPITTRSTPSSATILNGLLRTQLLGEREAGGGGGVLHFKAQRQSYEDDVPFKILDAPQLADDFYLSLVDWSAQNVLAVALGAAVYLWSACTSKVTRLCELGTSDSITSVAWTQRGSHLAIATSNGEVQLWDAAAQKQASAARVRTMMGHSGRIGSMSWFGPTLATGGRDKCIYLRDTRAREHFTSKLTGHRQEVCGLKWSPDGQQIASGGNDNKLLIWTAHSTTPLLRFAEHKAAVKAIAWSPHQGGLLASGGGTADMTIRFWNTTTAMPLQSVDTGSQVCNLAWSKNVNEIVSTHGYSLNQVILWRYPSMTKVATLTGHTLRVLYLAMAPDGQTVVTGAGDETLRFWNVFPGPKNKDGRRAGTSLLFPAGAEVR